VTLEAIGDVLVELRLRASLPFFDVFARVCDVDPQGVSRNVCDALVSGNRIRLQVSSGAHPRYARNPGTGEDRATATTMWPVEIELLCDGEHASALVLPAMP
jgi:predicted acyl esterase